MIVYYFSADLKLKIILQSLIAMHFKMCLLELLQLNLFSILMSHQITLNTGLSIDKYYFITEFVIFFRLKMKFYLQGLIFN